MTLRIDSRNPQVKHYGMRRDGTWDYINDGFALHGGFRGITLKEKEGDMEMRANCPGADTSAQYIYRDGEWVIYPMAPSHEVPAETFAPSAGIGPEYVVNNSTDTDDIKAIFGGQAVAIPVADNSAPTTKWDQVAVNAAALDQIKTFGDHRAGIRGAIRACDVGAAVIKGGKYEAKAAALDKALKIAFTPRISENEVVLDTTVDSDWTPTTGDPLDAMIEAEEKVSSTQALLAKVRRVLSQDQWALVVARANGLTQAEIAEKEGVSQMAISLRLKTINKKAVKATGIALV